MIIIWLGIQSGTDGTKNAMYGRLHYIVIAKDHGLLPLSCTSMDVMVRFLQLLNTLTSDKPQ
jgi:hypothetical protein